MSDLISRQAAIEGIERMKPYQLDGEDCQEILANLPSAQPEITLEQAIDRLHELGWMQEHDRIITESARPEPSCDGCKQIGKWENEVEYGYPSPCTRCKRRVSDNYER